jgi:hypothetical protein
MAQVETFKFVDMCGCAPVVKHLTHNPKIKDSNSGTGTRGENNY